METIHHVRDGVEYAIAVPQAFINEHGREAIPGYVDAQIDALLAPPEAPADAPAAIDAPAPDRDDEIVFDDGES